MRIGIGLTLFALFCSTPAFAVAGSAQAEGLCKMTRKTVHQIWQHDLYAAPPGIAALMVDAMDGKTADLLAGLHRLPAKGSQRWQLLALNTSALAGQTATVDALLDGGIDPNASAEVPPLKPVLYNGVTNAARHDPRFGPKAVNAFEKAGWMKNQSTPVGPPIYGAIQCDDLATAATLLRHGMDPMRRPWPHTGDPFVIAIVSGDADITQAFLSHGADPCVEDQRIAANWKTAHDNHPVHTVAGIGAKMGLPADLLAHLVCHAPPTSS